MEYKEILLPALLMLNNGVADDNSVDTINNQFKQQVHNIIPCDEGSKKHIIHVKQMHVRNRDESIVIDKNLIQSISNSQFNIYNILKKINSSVIFLEGVTSDNLKKGDIDRLRASRVKQAVQGDLISNLDYFIIKNKISELQDKKNNLEKEYFIIKRLDSIYKEYKNDLVSYYLNPDFEYLFDNEKKYISEKMNKDESFSRQIKTLSESFMDKLYKFQKESEVYENKLKENQKEEIKTLLGQYPYLGGGGLKMASDNNTKIMPGENMKLNDKANKLLEKVQDARHFLKIKLMRAGVIDFSKFIEKGHEKLAEELGFLDEYEDYLLQLSNFDKYQEKRDDFIIKSVSEYDGDDFNVPVVLGAAHDLKENVENYNNENIDSQLCLSEIDSDSKYHKR